MRGRITGWATLAVLLVAYESSASAQMNNKMGDLADQLRTQLTGEPVTVQQQGAITLTSAADAMFASGGWELNPSIPVLGKIIPTLAKLQRTEIVVGGYTDNTPIGAELQGKGVATNLHCRACGAGAWWPISSPKALMPICCRCNVLARPILLQQMTRRRERRRTDALRSHSSGTVPRS